MARYIGVSAWSESRGTMILALDIAATPLLLGLHDTGETISSRLAAAHKMASNFHSISVVFRRLV